MRNISITTGPVSFSSSSGETGNFTDAIARKQFYKDLIARANTVPISRVFRHYGLRLDENNKKIVCPFKSHSGGRESTPSFYLYINTNSYCCFGCRRGNHAVDFVAEMDGCSAAKAAMKIINLFNEDLDDDKIQDSQDFSERLEIMLDFSNTVRDFKKANVDEASFDFIENICMVYDTLNLKHNHNLSNEALRSIVLKLKKEISSYTCLIR